MSISDDIKQRLEEADQRYWAGDNISDYIQPGEKDMLIE